MKITLLDASHPGQDPALTAYLDRLEAVLAAQSHSVTRLRLAEIDLRRCNGCWGCWVKTPGECFSPDDSEQVCRATLASDFTLWAAPLHLGFPAARLKTAIDKSIPLLHPYFAVAAGEIHHRRRYDRYPRLGLLVDNPTGSDLQVITDIFGRTALNMKSRLEFCQDTHEPPESLAARLTAPPRRLPPLPLIRRSPGPSLGGQIAPPQTLTVFNGSPRGRKGNTPILLNQFVQGFTASGPGRSAEVLHLNRTRQTAEFVDAFARAECVFLGLPIYTDSLPGLVMDFIEHLEPLVDRPSNPPLGFLVQCGFPETGHIRFLERYLEQLAAQLNSPFLGVIARGNSEAIRLMPESSNRKTYSLLQQLGQEFGQTGRLDPVLLKQVAGLERVPTLLIPLLHLAMKVPYTNFYWDMLLKQNNAVERRFYRPYEE
jgi:multimeric flavodoxin WrbA